MRTFENIVNTIANLLGNPPRNGERKNENEKNEEEDDGAEGGGEDVQLRLQVKHPSLRILSSEHILLKCS